MATFYQSIAKFYDDIFPLNPLQKDFVLTSAGDRPKNKSLLDIGCGTGSLVLELEESFEKDAGIDADPDMIEAARRKARAAGSGAVFECLNMLDIGHRFRNNGFDIILCFGNTLVHLADAAEIGDFLKQTKRLLHPGGKLLLQIVHYDRIIARDIRELPLIENKRIRFERFYHYSAETGKMEFETVLRVRDSDLVVRNRIELFPILKDEIELLLLNAGYSDIMYYGNFKGEPLSELSAPLIIEAF